MADNKKNNTSLSNNEEIEVSSMNNNKIGNNLSGNSSMSNQPSNNQSSTNKINNKKNNTKKTKKTGLMKSLYKSARNSVMSKSKPKTVKNEFDLSRKGMVKAEDYKNELIEKEEKRLQEEKKAEDLGVTFDPDTGEPLYPPVDLEDFLQGRRQLKREEFKKLQKEQGFYFSNAMEEYMLKERRKHEGLHFLGVNLNALLDLARTPLKTDTDPLESGKSFELIGEYVDMDKEYDKVLEDKVGLRLGPDRVVKPEDKFFQDSSFDDILEESKNYTGLNKKYISPKTLVTMVRILDKYKKNEIQWLRVATAVEIIYRYLKNEGESRDEFFESNKELKGKSLLELEEFFKTDHLFMTLKDLKEFKKDLQYYTFKEPVDNEK